MPTATKPRSSRARTEARRCYVLDTSVLLSDPRAVFRFDEHEVVIPLVVIIELEAKRTHPELGYFAREALRMLDDFRIDFGRLDERIPLNDEGGTLRVELNHSDLSRLPAGMQLGDNDTRILAVARNMAAEGRDVVVVSKDLPLRVKASTLGLQAEEYRAELVVSTGWTGIEEVEVGSSVVNELYDNERVELDVARDLPCNTGVVLISERGSALARVTPDKRLRLVRGDREAFGLHGRSAEQRIALDLLLDPDIGIISLGGRAGTGKSALALCAGLEAVLERQQHRKVVVFRPLFAVGGQELGYLPGSEHEKMSPWGQAVFDTLGAITTSEVVDEVLDRGMLEVLPLTHIRGRSLHDAFVIVDEAQSLERNVLLTVLSRIGKDSRVVLTHDVAQRDNLRVGRHDGVVAVVEKLKGHPLFAHVTLTRSERSPIAALVTEMLEDLPN
ncbi:MAG: PhoH family protein [Candidatus Nanopelagicales bacterium]|nr:PhoH family protein [Candidatus Nanopelagicales bacterium]